MSLLKFCAINFGRGSAMAAALAFTLSMALPTSAGTRPDLEDFSEIKMNMMKTDLIELMGSPNEKRRHKGSDVWTYWFFIEENGYMTRQKKEVRITQGVVSYKGDPQKSKGPTAEEQDEINEKLAKKEAAKVEERKIAAKKSRLEYDDWNNGVKEVDPNESVPRFKPVK